MYLKNIHGHTIDLSLLSNGGWVLDLGCRDFLFSGEMLYYRMNVVAVDPYKDLKLEFKNEVKNFNFINKACVGIKKDKILYHEYTDWGANSIFKHEESLGYDNIKKYEVETITIEEIMKQFNIECFDLIKIDVEGSEYEILQNFNVNAKQISVEYHDWLKLNPYENVEDFYTEIENNQLKNYEVKFRKKVPMGDDGGETYSDVLYVRK